MTIWIGTDCRHEYVRSGEDRRAVKVKPRLVTDPVEARAVSALYKRKYGPFVGASKPNQPLTPGEQTTFELLPAEDGG